jgi:pyruvate,water dikinase
VAEYGELLATDEDRAAFEQKLSLARVVFPYVENHNFYVEHWSHSVLWRKMRQLGGVLAKEGFFGAENDIFLLKRDEVPEALWDYYSAWAVGTPPRGPAYWGRELERRRGILTALRSWSPPPALGRPSRSPSCCGASPARASSSGWGPATAAATAPSRASPPPPGWPRARPG